MYKGREITVVIPALNEEQSIGLVIDELFELRVCAECANLTHSGSDRQTHTTESSAVALCSCAEEYEQHQLVDQILVCNNGSTDNTAGVASERGAIVTEEPERGYGAACLAALAVPVKKDIIVFVDADHSVVAHYRKRCTFHPAGIWKPSGNQSYPLVMEGPDNRPWPFPCSL